MNIAVVGGGIIGLLTAIALANREPTYKISLFDSSDLAGNATRQSLCLDLPFGYTAGKREFSERSRELWNHFQDSWLDYNFQKTTLHGIVRSDDVDRILKGFFDHSKIIVEPVNKLLSPFSFDLNKDYVLLKGERCWYAQGDGLYRCLLEVLKNISNIHYHSKPFLEHIVSSKEFVTTTFQDGATVYFDKVILALGPWLPKFINKNPHLNIQNIRTKKIACFKIDKMSSPTHPVYYFFSDDAFLVPNKVGSDWWLSITVKDWDVDPDDTLTISDLEYQAAKTILNAYAPAYVDYCYKGRVFCDAYSETWEPIIDYCDEYKNIIFASGCSGSGVRLAPAIAEKSMRLLFSEKVVCV